jgi:hypothetical protein
VEAVDNVGCSSLHFASSECFGSEYGVKVARLLVESGAKVEAAGNNGMLYFPDRLP